MAFQHKITYITMSGGRLPLHSSRHPSLSTTRSNHCDTAGVLVCRQWHIAVNSLQVYWHASNTHTHTHSFNGPLSESTQVSWYQKGKANLDFTEATDSEWQWHQLGHIQVCTSLQTDNHASTPPLTFLQVGCPSCRPTNSVKAFEACLQVHNILQCHLRRTKKRP